MKRVLKILKNIVLFPIRILGVGYLIIGYLIYKYGSSRRVN